MDPRAAKYRAELEAIRANADPVAFAICQRWHGEKFAVPGHGATSFVRGQLSAAEVAVAVVLARLAGAERAEVDRLRAERDRYLEALEKIKKLTGPCAHGHLEDPCTCADCTIRRIANHAKNGCGDKARAALNPTDADKRNREAFGVGLKKDKGNDDAD